MKYYELNMGEGIAGSSAIGAATTAIYTCMGIAFVARERLFGGMYHYPANNLSMNVTGTLRQMVQDIQPSAIYLTPAGSQGFGSMGSSQDDIEDVIKFLGTVSMVKVEVLEAADYANLIWVNDVPTLNSSVKVRRDVSPQVIDLTLRQTMSAGAREVEADVWYYGGDGEIKGVLEQGLTTTKPGRKTTRKQCIIL